MNAQQLRNSILQEAIEGRLVPQDPNDEPASALLNRIRVEKKRLVKEGKLKKKDLEETPISEDEIPFDIPESWEWVRLNALCTFLSRGKSPLYSDVPTNYPVFAQKCNLKDGGISLEQARFLKPETVSKWQEEYHLRTDDVLVNSTGTGTVCRTRLFNENCLGKYPFTVPDSHVSVVRTSDNIFSAYICFLFNSKLYQDYWEDRLAGSTNQKELYIGVLQNTIIPLPPLAEQKRIVAKIEEMLPKVEEYGKAQDALNKLNEELPEKLKKSVLQEAIEGRLVPQDPNDEPASVLLEHIREEKKRLVKEGKLKKKDLEVKPISEDEIPFDIPDSWEWVRLGNVAEIARGGSPRPIKEYITEDSNGLNWIKIGDTDKGGKYINSCKEKIKPEGLKKTRIVHPGDFLLTNSMSFGRPYITNIEGCIHDGWLMISPFAGAFEQSYLYYVLSSAFAHKQFNDKVAGAVVQNLNSDKVAESLIPLPPLAEQKRIVAKIEEVFKEIDKLKK